MTPQNIYIKNSLARHKKKRKIEGTSFKFFGIFNKNNDTFSI